MSTISKACADFLRTTILSETNEKLKATHARELVAALFGYRSHAALLADEDYSLDQIDRAYILVPDISLMDSRRRSLEGLPTRLPDSEELARTLTEFLKSENLFSGSVWWLSDNLENYVRDDFLPEHDFDVMEDLSGPMADTNAYFDETSYDEATIFEEDGIVYISVTGQCKGSSDPDKPFSGDQIDMTVSVTLRRIAGRACYTKPKIRATGDVNWDWADPNFSYE